MIARLRHGLSGARAGTVTATAGPRGPGYWQPGASGPGPGPRARPPAAPLRLPPGPAGTAAEVRGTAQHRGRDRNATDCVPARAASEYLLPSSGGRHYFLEK
jgi:hypothetical protein